MVPDDKFDEFVRVYNHDDVEYAELMRKYKSDNRFTDEFEKYSGVSALLTSSQRTYLCGNSDIEEKSADERSVRSRIRKRLTRSIFDLKILHNDAEPRDIQKAFDLKTNIFKSAAGAVGLIFDGILRAGVYSGQEITDKEPIRRLEHLVQSSLNALYTQRGKEVNKIDVSIDIEFGRDVDEISTGELDQLDQDELFLLYEKGQIGQQELISALDISRDGVPFNTDNN
jgi:hypothetical protein